MNATMPAMQMTHHLMEAQASPTSMRQVVSPASIVEVIDLE
jgi:hypothetical protein